MYHTLHSLSLDKLQATHGRGFFLSPIIVLPRPGRATIRSCLFVLADSGSFNMSFRITLEFRRKE